MFSHGRARLATHSNVVNDRRCTLIFKIKQPESDPTEFFHLDAYVQAFKSYIKTVAGYLNPSHSANQNDVDDLFELAKSLALVISTFSRKF